MMTAPTGSPVTTQGPNNMPPTQRPPTMPAQKPGMYAPAQGTVPPAPPPAAQPFNVFDASAQSLNSGMQAATTAAYYQPQQVTATNVAPTTVTPQQLNSATTAMMNPYTQQVTQTTMDQLAQQEAMALNNLDAQASAAGAFGGSRHGVAMGTTMGEYADAQAQALAQLNYQGYTTAQQAAQQQALANQQAQQQAAMANQQAGLTAGMANQSAGLQAANVNLAGANALGGLSNLGFTQGMTIAGQQQAMGQEQQAINQALIDQAKNQYAGFTQYPSYSLNNLYPAMGVQTGSTTTGTQSYNPGLFDYLSLGMTAAG